MTCYVTNDGTIKLDNHKVGFVRCTKPKTAGLHWWVWGAVVNGQKLGNYGDIVRSLAIKNAIEEVELEAAVIR